MVKREITNKRKSLRKRKSKKNNSAQTQQLSIVVCLFIYCNEYI